MLEFLFSPVFFNSVHQMVEYIIRISIYIFTLGVVAYFIAMLFRLSTDTENRDNYYHLFLVGFSAIGLATYKIWAIWLGKLFVLFANAIFDLESGNIMTEYLGTFFSNPDGGGLRLSILNLLSLESLSSLSYFLVMVVYEIFVVIQVIVQIFLYMLGPLAIVLSLFPTFRDIFKVWLANFCAVNFWSVLIAILFRLVKTLIGSAAFQQSLAAGEKGVLWSSFILGVIISVIIILIPRLSLAIFKGGSAAADIGTYGVGITASVVVSTVWKRLKMMSINASQQLATNTGTGIISGTQALTKSAASLSTQSAVKSLTEGGEGASNIWPFEESKVVNSGGGGP
jgi:hypothetical protein